MWTSTELTSSPYYNALGSLLSGLGLQKLSQSLKVLRCQLKAIICIIFLLLSSIPSALVCAIFWFIKSQDKDQDFANYEKKSTPSKKKTVLITGAPLTKSLHLARTMGQAGHRVIVADKDWKHMVNASRFSTYVTKFVSLPNDIPYDDALVQIWEEENVDFFLPVSHIHLAVDDIKAKIKMQARAAELKRPFFDLAINNLEVIEELDDKHRFLQKSQEMGLPVPDFKTFFGQDLSVELGTLRSEGKFNGKHYFLKPLELQREERMDMTRIPSDKAQFEEYVEQHLMKKDLSVPYLLNEFIKGEEYAANIICKDGKIYMFQVCPSSPIQTNYVSVEHKGILDWVTTFVKATNLSGLVCFDFLVDNNDNAYCIECNPRLHSAIVSFESQTKMNELHQSLLSALHGKEPTSQMNDSINLINHTEVYWIFQELEKLFSGESSLKRFLNLVQHGQDAVWQIDDPLPFLVLNFVQIPWLLLVATIKGTLWSKVNFCLGQVL